MKQCTNCKEGKDTKYFSKDINRKDGLDHGCKNCKKEYYKNNKNKIKESSRKYRENNKDRIKEYNKEYYNLPVPYNSNIKCRIELYEESVESRDNNLMCKCASCDRGFEPTYKQIQNRIDAINGKLGNAECRLYCSDLCKNNCPVYHQKKYIKDQKPTATREVQPELAKMVFERDNYTCQKCHTHRDNLEVGIHCHHKEGVLGDPLQSADMDMCITLCEDCHKEVHQIPGCGYQDMQCKEPKIIFG